MILTDFDGTLVKDWEMVYELWKKIADRYGIKFTKKYFREKFSPEWQKVAEKVYGIDLKKEKPIFKKELKRNYLREISKQEIIPELAEYLKHKEFGVVTSGFSGAVKELVEKAGLKPLIIVSSDETGTSDKKELLKFTLKKLKAKNRFYVGDTEQDITAARKNGLKSVAVTWGFHPKKRLEKAKPDYLVTRVSQLIELLDVLTNS